MAEYWKSTPRYWCKHCNTYIRDTKLERSNHEATPRHQRAIERALGSLHRTAERAEREQDRAKREVERLNGIISSSGSGSGGGGAGNDGSASSRREAQQQQTTASERQRQLEQLADLGVNIPDQLRGDMSLAGEWTVTATRVVKEEGGGEGGAEAVVMGVRKREHEKTEDQVEEETAVEGLFKKRKRWGRDTRVVGGEEDAELDALLSGPLGGGVVVAKKEEREEEAGDGVPVKKEEDGETLDGTGGSGLADGTAATATIKREPGSPSADVVDGGGDAGAGGGKNEASPEVPAVVFKKRKPKNIRQK